MKTALILILAAAGAWADTADTVESAQKALSDGDYETAARLYEKAAKKGDADAQYNLGVLFFNGQGVAQDYPAALKWFKKAARKEVEACYYIGFIYDNGDGVPVDQTEAAKWYEKSAQSGNPKAERKLARLYQDGKGVPQDFGQAFQWYERAADADDAEAQFGLGTMYELGQGFEHDFDKAAEWYGRALKGGHPQAQDRLDKLKVLKAQEDLVKMQQHVARSTEVAASTAAAPVEPVKTAPPPPESRWHWGVAELTGAGVAGTLLFVLPPLVVLERKRRKSLPPPPAPAPAPQPLPKAPSEPSFKPADDAALSASVRRELDVLQYSRRYIQAGQVQTLVAQCAGKPPELCSAYAAAFLKLNNYRGALALLGGKSDLDADDYAVYRAAQLKLGKLELLEPSQIPERGKAAYATALMEAGEDKRAEETLLEGRAGAFSKDDAAAGLRLALRTGDLAVADKFLAALPKADEAPGVWYYAALLCEKSGRPDAAVKLYARIPGHKDAAGRMRRLEAMPGDEASRLAAVMEVFTSPPGTPLARAFSEHFVGRYELLRPLGVGSTGCLYKASDRAVTRDVVIKRFPAALAKDERARERFLKQGELALKIGSAHLAGVLDVVTTENGLFLASAFVDGESLFEIMANRGKFPAKKLLPLLKAACEGIVAAHDGKVIHGGLKPSNILLDKTGSVKVTDLGFSELAGRKFEGLPYYGAPELASTGPTPQTDLYSMGLAACELLTGEAPGAEGYVERFAANAELAATPEGKALHAAVMDCLKPDPAARPKTMGQLMSRLQGI